MHKDQKNEVIEILKVVFNYDWLYISGGGAQKIKFKLDKNISLVGNRDGIKGGAKLWEQKDKEDVLKGNVLPHIDNNGNLVL